MSSLLTDGSGQIPEQGTPVPTQYAAANLQRIQEEEYAKKLAAVKLPKRHHYTIAGTINGQRWSTTMWDQHTRPSQAEAKSELLYDWMQVQGDKMYPDQKGRLFRLDDIPGASTANVVVTYLRIR